MAEGDFAILDGWISGLRALARDGITEIAEEAREEIQKIAKATAAAGTDPSGKPWAPRKEDGGRAMKNAADHVFVVAAGPTLRIVLKGADVWHQYGTRGAGRRQVIPDASDPIPPAMVAALLRARDRVIARRLGGAR